MDNQGEDEAGGTGHEGFGRALRDWALPTVHGIPQAIVKPRIQANNFEIKPATLQMVQNQQFGGLASEDPNTHISNFLEICDTFKFNGVTDDAIRLRLFPFSLRDRAKSWLNSLPSESIVSWDDLAQKFLSKYFPPAKTARLRIEISNFAQFDGETLYDAWEWFKDLLRRCPHHGLPLWMQVQTFYNGLAGSTRTLIDAASGGTFMSKTQENAYELLEDMAMNNYQWPSERSILKKSIAAIQENDQISVLSAQVASLSQKMNSMTSNVANSNVVICDFCGGAHQSNQCQANNPFAQSSMEQANFVRYQQQQQQQLNPYSNTFNAGWRNHPNFSWKNQNSTQPIANMQHPPGFHQGVGVQQSNMQQHKDGDISLKDALTQLSMNTSQFISRTEATLTRHESSMQRQETAIRNIEIQVGQLSKELMSRQPGTLPSNTETNPREHVQAITLRSGKELVENEEKPIENDKVLESRSTEKKISENGKSKLFPDDPPIYVPPLPFP